MGNSKFSFATVFSIMVLLVFCYITFLGLVYWKNGELTVPILLTIGLFILVLACVFVMCKSKATRWKKIGIVVESLFGLIILGALVLAAFPFTNFIRVVNDKADIIQKVNYVCDAAIDLDYSYEDYVDNRIKNYKLNLTIIGDVKDINPTYYDECLGNAFGETDEEKIENLSESLKKNLLPQSTKTIVKERQNNIEKARNPKIWNPLTPSNINKVEDVVTGWVENYKELSEIFYIGEDIEPFNYERFDVKLKELTENYKEFKSPQPIAILISLVCFFIMLLPYILTERSIVGNTQKKNLF